MTGFDERIDRMESRFNDRLSSIEGKIDRLSDEVSESRGRERERRRWLATVVGFVSAVGAAGVSWVLGLFGKH